MPAAVLKKPKQTASAPIMPEAYYGFPQLPAVGIGAAVLRKWRRQGMPVLYVGRCGYVKGSELIKFLEANASGSRAGCK